MDGGEPGGFPYDMIAEGQRLEAVVAENGGEGFGMLTITHGDRANQP